MFFRACSRSVRFAIALETAAVRSMAWSWKVGSSVSSRRMDQKSGVVGSKTRARRASSARVTAASASSTASSRCATSASASTMSIGAMVPISTRDRLFRSDSCASSSDWRWTLSELIAYARSQ